jgi:hypothetical protein
VLALRSIKVSKKNELIMDYRKLKAEHAPIHINRAVVERVENFKFLSVHITKDISWSRHTNTVMRRARQRLFHLGRLKIFGMYPQIFKKVYISPIESILIGCITAWYGNRKALLTVVRTAQYITWAELIASQNQYRVVSEEGHKNVQRLQPPKS